VVELRVADEGDGFAAGLETEAFGRFTRADEARRGGGGSGLGLAIVDAVARAHGGTASLAANGQGTVVTLTLPAGAE
jgi:two-component system OmpR family sensor kinase